MFCMIQSNNLSEGRDHMLKKIMREPYVYYPLPIIMLYVFYVAWASLTISQDYGSSDEEIIIASVSFTIVTFLLFFKAFNNQKKLKNDSLDMSKYIYRSNTVKFITNSFLLLLFMLVLSVIVFNKNAIGERFLINHVFSENDWRIHYDYICLSLLLVSIRCYLGAALVPSKIINSTLNIIRFVFLLVGIVLPFTRYRYISVSPILSATVLSILFDSLLNSFTLLKKES